MGAGTEKWQFGFGHVHKIMVEEEICKYVFINDKPDQIFYYDHPDRLH